MRKYYVSYITIISILSLVCINNISALSYQSEVGIGFTFNPTLSLSLDSSDLAISNLTPGTTGDSNSISVNVATNAAYGYTLSATVDNTNLTHTNETNTWGYSYKNNLASTPTWSNYSGLSTSTSKVLFNTDSNTSSSIDFKIGAKASNTQASGTYTNTINFIVVSKPMPKTIEDIAYMQTFGELNPTDLESVKNSMVLNYDYILKDSRDEKEYYVTKLEDGNVWMTQNLDLDIDENTTYTHYDTDLGWTTNDPTAIWQPTYSTSSFVANNSYNWTNSYNTPRSADLGQKYVYTSNSTATDIEYSSLQECVTAGQNNCTHYHIGNYYNWAAAVANNNTNRIVSRNSSGSICPSGWKLPATENNSNDTYEFKDLFYTYGVLQNSANNSFTSNGLDLIRITPLYFVRGGAFSGSAERVGNIAQYWSSSASSEEYHSRGLYFTNNIIYVNGNLGRNSNISVRCLAR